MGSNFSKKLIGIRAQAGVLDADLIQVSVAEDRYLDVAVDTAHGMSDDQLQQALDRLSGKAQDGA